MSSLAVVCMNRQLVCMNGQGAGADPRILKGGGGSGRIFLKGGGGGGGSNHLLGRARATTLSTMAATLDCNVQGTVCLHY